MLRARASSSTIELKDLALHRSCLNEDEALDLYNKKFIQSSLEFYNPLTKSNDGIELNNSAQSLTRAKISKHVVVEHQNVGFKE